MINGSSSPGSPSLREPEVNAYGDHEILGSEAGYLDPVYSTMVNTYYEVWEDFYAWNELDSLGHLESLAAPSDLIATRVFDFGFELDSDGAAADDEDSRKGESVDLFTVCEWDAIGQLTKHTTPVKSGTAGRRHTRKHNAWFQEHARYEACTPSNMSIFVDIDDKLATCPYIKYGDSPEFDARRYLQQFKVVSWQEPGRDPDQTVIAATTIQRLTSSAKNANASGLRISWNDIDAFRIFPYDASTIFHQIKHTDLPSWPSPSFVDQLKPLWHSSHEISTAGRLTGILSSFCPRLGCIQFECFNDPYPTGWVAGRTETSGLDNETFKANYISRTPCGQDCFLSRAADDALVVWDTNETSHLLDEMLVTNPHALPCDIAQILLGEVPCYKIFVRRGEKISTVSLAENRPKPVPPAWKDLGEIEQYTIPIRCDHEGPCDRKRCPCFREGVHCQRNCLCDASCDLRYDGCECSAKDHEHSMCSSESKRGKCYCAAYSWECNSELCGHTASRKQRLLSVNQNAGTISCKNVDVQWKLSPPIEIKTGAYGLGAFAKQLIPRNEFVGEYIAELFMHTRYYVDTKDFLHKFTGYNYSFSLNTSVVADAANVGNEMRFFNHSVEEANIEPRVKLVNGDHKVTFYALRQIKKGEEILFNYGDNYWKND